MKRAMAANIVGLFLCCSLAAAQSDHPVEKVITMLEGLIEKAKMDGKNEAVTYDKFEYWGRNAVKELNTAIAEEHEVIEVQEDIIAAKTQRANTLTDQIGELILEIEQRHQSNDEADKLRKKTAHVYTSSSADLKATITAILTAITGLEEAQTNTALVTARQQVQAAFGLVASVATDVQHDALATFLQQKPDRPDLLAKDDREDHVEKFHFRSGGVIEVLKQLMERFKKELLAVDKGETNSLNNHDLAMQASDAAIEAAKKSNETKTNELADVTSDIASAKQLLKDTKDDLKADSSTLDATKTSIAIKKTEWEARSDVRNKEIEAMKIARGILAKVTGVRTEPPKNPVPPPSPVEAEAEGESFLQVADPRMKAIELLRREARATHSKALEVLAEEVSAHADGPFDEVNGMIEKMIFRLMAEQTDEDNHKNWCDQELGKWNASKINKEDKMDALSDKIDVAITKIAQLTEGIKEANDMVKDITEYMNEAAEIRKVGKEENKVAVKDSQDAQTAIANAIAVLEAFYKESGQIEKEAWEFVQREPVTVPEEPKTWGESYTGIADPKKQPHGILAMLEKINTEFATMEADTLAQEETDKTQYEEDMSRCEIERARRLKESDMKMLEKKRLAAKVDAMQKSHKSIAGEHEAVVQYLHDLRPACVEGDSTYDARKAARTEEIEALQEAQVILRDAFKQKDKNATQTTEFMQRSFLRSLRGGR